MEEVGIHHFLARRIERLGYHRPSSISYESITCSSEIEWNSSNGELRSCPMSHPKSDQRQQHSTTCKS